MGIFRKKDKGILDLTEKYHRQQGKVADIQDNIDTGSDTSSNAFSFLGDMASASDSSSMSDSGETVDLGTSIDVRKRQISKKLLEMTERIEDLSNQIYHLQQRIEVLERKAGVGRY